MSMIAVPDASLLPTLLEATMMLCFGIAWPLANLRMLRTGRAEGKGLMFTLIILCGYGAGLGGQVGAGCPGRGAAGGVVGGGHIPDMNPLRSARDWIRDIHHAR